MAKTKMKEPAQGQQANGGRVVIQIKVPVPPNCATGETVRDKLLKDPAVARGCGGPPGMGKLTPSSVQQFKPSLCAQKPQSHTGMCLH